MPAHYESVDKCLAMAPEAASGWVTEPDRGVCRQVDRPCRPCRPAQLKFLSSFTVDTREWECKGAFDQVG